jgi:dihydrofolate reductase/predicted DNA-binding protein with PD1-like motif
VGVRFVHDGLISLGAAWGRVAPRRAEGSQRVHLVEVGRGQELVATIGRAVARLGITDGAITLVGAVHEARVSVMRKSDALDDLVRDYAQPFELTGTGEITGGAVHLHVTLAGEDLVVAGHLHSATVREFFVHAYVTPLWTGGTPMPKLRVHNIATSLDGFAAGPSQDLEHPLGVGGERLHEWIFETRYGRTMIGQDGGTEGTDDAFLRRGDANIGATVMGRNMFGPIRGDWGDSSWSGWWGDEPPYHHDVFVLTHHPRPDLAMKGGTTFHFVTDGLDSALRQAFAAARGKDVRLGGGAATIRAALAAGLVDELHVAVAPILLGTGEPLFADNVAAAYEVTELTPSARVTHYVLTKTA